MSFRAEGLLRKAILLEEENADLRLVYITTKTDLMSMHKRSVIEEIVLESGLKTSLDPPLIIEKFNERKRTNINFRVIGLYITTLLVCVGIVSKIIQIQHFNKEINTSSQPRYEIVKAQEVIF